MKRGSSRGISRGRPKNDVADSRELLERLARVLVLSGRRPEELRQEFAEVCRGIAQPSHRWDPGRLGFVADLPHVISRWHDDEDYLDAEGRPVPLPRDGPGRSLTGLIERVLPLVDSKKVIESLIQLRGLRRRGKRFVPTDRHLALNEQPTAGLAHGLMSVLGILRTIEHNLSAPPGKRLFERAAINPRFPVRALPQFQRELARCAGEIIWNVDAQMLREETRRRSGRKMRLGVGIYVFRDPLRSERVRARNRSSASTASPRGAARGSRRR